MTVFDDLYAAMELVKGLPEPVAYIVLDHNMPSGPFHIEDRDGRGRKYLQCSPSILDAAKHVKYGPVNVVSDPLGVVGPLAGIPLYRREDMPEGWPYDSASDEQDK